MSVDFGEVRSVVHGGYSEASWERLCELCERASDEEWGEQLEPYVMSVVEGWPVSGRKIPSRWLRHVLERGQAQPYMKMAASLRLALTPQTMTGAFDLRRLAPLATPALRELSLSVSGLDLKRYKDRLDVSALVGSEALSGLRTLELGGALLDAATLERVAQNAALRGVEVFGIADATIDKRLIEALEVMPFGRGGALRGVTLSRCDGLDEALARSAIWSDVTALALHDDRYVGRYDAAFSRHEQLNTIKHLKLHKVRQDAMSAGLLEPKPERQLETLVVEECFTVDKSLLFGAIAGSRLRCLSLSGMTLSGETDLQWRELFGERGAATSLEALSLEMELATLFVEAQRGELEGLRMLRLNGSLTTAHAETLASWQLPRLEALVVRLDDGGQQESIRALMEAPWADRIKRLRVKVIDYYGSTLRAALERRWGSGRVEVASWFGAEVAPMWDVLGRMAQAV